MTAALWMLSIWTLVIFFPSASLASSAYPLLRDSFDSHLQRQLNDILQRQGLTPVVRRKKLSIALVDLSQARRPRVAAVNGDEMIYAASLPKIAILLGAFVQVEQGKLSLNRQIRRLLTDMIRVSSNTAATTMLNRVGKPNLARILQSSRFRLYDPSVNGGLWVGKDYGKARAWKRDPLHNLSHAATALQTARFYYLLETGRLVSPQLSREMKQMLSKPAIQHKFVKGLRTRPGARIYRKSGTWRHWHADSVLVERGSHKYIAVALAENSKGGEWFSQLIGPLEDLIVRRQLPPFLPAVVRVHAQ